MFSIVGTARRSISIRSACIRLRFRTVPELPEVETMRRGVQPVVGGVIRGLTIPRTAFRPIRIRPTAGRFRQRVVGQHIVEAKRLGKRIGLCLADGDIIVFEPRMTGLLLVTEPPDREHLRFGLHLSDAPLPDVWFWDRRGLGSVRLLGPRELDGELGPARLGPDALAVSASQLRQRLGASRREIKVALLDQRAIAGIGNLYAAEILHLAAVHPRMRCDRMTAGMWHRLHDAMGYVLREAIRHEGSTLADGTYRDALNRQGAYQNHHQVYARAGQPCPRCRRATIRRIVQAQRATFYCPRCQR
jgi:formamidopyrimidine-DNA glycosylase